MLTEYSVKRQSAGLVFVLRIGISADVGRLEWFGTFTEHRHIIEEAFIAQARGRGLVLVASLDDFPVAQLWVRYSRAQGRAARFWALRVMDPFRGLGLGSRLLGFGEQVLVARKFGNCEIGVEKSNTPARRLYQKLGYRLRYEQIEEYSYLTPNGELRNGKADQWIMQKKLPLSERSSVMSEGQAQRENTVLSDEPSNVRAGPLLPAGRSRATEARVYSGRRSARRIARARDYGGKTASRS
jgi:ribosomal protein S18 acetylase RimI-like enzyme